MSTSVAMSHRKDLLTDFPSQPEKWLLEPCAGRVNPRGLRAGPSPAGGQWCPAPHLKSVPPHFTFGSPVATYIQYCILKMFPPLLVVAPAAKSWRRAWLRVPAELCVWVGVKLGAGRAQDKNLFGPVTECWPNACESDMSKKVSATQSLWYKGIEQLC